MPPAQLKKSHWPKPVAPSPSMRCRVRLPLTHPPPQLNIGRWRLSFPLLPSIGHWRSHFCPPQTNQQTSHYFQRHAVKPPASSSRCPRCHRESQNAPSPPSSASHPSCRRKC